MQTEIVEMPGVTLDPFAGATSARTELARRLWVALIFAALSAGSLFAQFGDRNFQPGDPPQRPPSSDIEIPPAPVLAPEEALRSFSLPANFRIELVAAEPLVRDPVAIAFDPRGRLWVAELSAYNSELITQMPVYLDPQQPTPTRPPGRIVMLEDTDADGRMDRRTVYWNNLDVPRAIAFVGDRVLIGEPPNLWLTRDRDGDGVMDEKVLLDDKFGDPKLVQGAPNGLLWGRDNWLYNAAYRSRWRPTADGEWRREPLAYIGQWGITQDDFGRIFFTRNSQQLQGNLLPIHHLSRVDGGLRTINGVDVAIASDAAVWPVRVTPGVNRGYEQNVQRETGIRSELREEGTITKVTAAAGVTIYRGTNFPAGFEGNAFIAEPGGNFVRRLVISEGPGRVTGAPAYANAEFLASTDERFRPVYLSNAPDGTLYVVDYHRGILEGLKSITTYLRDQVIQRGLHRPLWGLGRIYRVVYEPGPRSRLPDFARADTGALIALLTDANGWTRDTAQRWIVDRPNQNIVPALRELVGRGAHPRDRVAALWCLDGLDALGDADVEQALDDADERVRCAAVEAAAARLRGPEGARLRDRISARVATEQPMFLANLALALAGRESTGTGNLIWKLLPRAGESSILTDAVIVALRGKEVETLAWMRDRLIADRGLTFGARGFLESLSAQSAFSRGKGAEALTAAISDPRLPQLHRLSLMRGATQGSRPVLPATSLADLAEKAPDPWVRRRATEIMAKAKERQARIARRPPVDPFTPEQQQRFDAGRIVFQACAACHEPDGRGRPGVSPTLHNGYWSNHVSPEAAIRIALDGKVGGFPAPMPPFAGLGDEEIASVLTFIRRSWGNSASAVAPSEVARTRAAQFGGNQPWTDRQLASISGEPYAPERYTPGRAP